MGRPRSWTDDDLRAALDGATSMAEVVRRLRLKRGGAAYVTVRSRMEQLGLRLLAPPADHPASSRPDTARTEHQPRKWTEDDLRFAVAQARSLNDVFTRRGLAVGGSQWLVIRSLIRERGWPTDHWDRPLRGGSVLASQAAVLRTALEETDLHQVVARSRSLAATIRALGCWPTTSTYRELKEAIRARGISTDHFESHYAAVRRAPRRRYRQPLDEILVRDSPYTNIATLKQRLVEAELLAPECAACGIDKWRARPIVLHLDHINGVRNDHRLENLRLLCPNCHSQTDTYCGRNWGRYADQSTST